MFLLLVDVLIISRCSYYWQMFLIISRCSYLLADVLSVALLPLWEKVPDRADEGKQKPSTKNLSALSIAAILSQEIASFLMRQLTVESPCERLMYKPMPQASVYWRC